MGDMFKRKVAELLSNIDIKSVTDNKKESEENKPDLGKSDTVQIIKEGEVRVVKEKKLKTYLDTGWEIRK